MVEAASTAPRSKEDAVSTADGCSLVRVELDRYGGSAKSSLAVLRRDVLVDLLLLRM